MSKKPVHKITCQEFIDSNPKRYKLITKNSLKELRKEIGSMLGDPRISIKDILKIKGGFKE